MGYFKSGTETMAYINKHCMKCQNWENGDNPGCPIQDAHMAHQSERQDVLDMLIPRGNGNNLKCRMFMRNTVIKCSECLMERKK